MSPFIILLLMAASVATLFGLSGAMIWWAGRLPTEQAAVRATVPSPRA
ncbi:MULTISPECIES: hypothetical protein [Salipiger]|jgi:hypothetical protein|uniref:Uncharacterized protein n=1 Tax=Salipiger profundus TaxID=1229727 RepID=A0A1U7D217_9RHOB|nr:MULTISPECIES: hypothetical protein [Salipiger]APX22110.1 hypothetical protein Ga0080559_TMP1314 [Salipiger profundus]GGA07580.1 hypothetical protein GCM10011326_19270 [Salipiger profundus]SFC45311.1 hypothetical protein SAMN05444415_103297 [Salipiger profundus]|tara:strand:- start:62 stop:205 length:144 start_codon:yes stop_codon:yes gene_type:complete